jgi:amidase
MNCIYSPSRRHFLRVGLSAGVAASLADFRAEAVEPSNEQSVAELQAALASGRITSKVLTESYLSRIASIDQQGPALRSVIEVNPDAVSIAEKLDRERKEKGPRGPLHGIPVLIKDNIDTADRMATTAGSLALVGSKPPSDAFLVKQLRKAGVVLLGKTNLSEWANFRSNRSTSGWSGRGGQTKNPYALDRNPSGSSSGSAVAVAANLCAVAVGTETDGSIISPATTCGIVGIKPTVGLVSRSGVIPIAASQDTAGPMGRTVADAAALLAALVGVDEEDSVTKDAKASEGYTKFLDAEGLKGARIGVVRRNFSIHERVDALMKDALEAMKNAGAELIDLVEMEGMARIGQAELTVLQYEFKAGLNAYFARLGTSTPIKSLKELIEFNRVHAKEELPYFGQETFIRSEARGDLTDKEYLDAVEKCRKCSRTDGIDAVMEKHNLDALVAPSGGPASVTDLICGTRGLGGSSSAAAVAGYPNITVPAGFVFGLPVGISFFGRAWSEPTLIRIAYGFEQTTKHRKPPRFLPTAELA